MQGPQKWLLLRLMPGDAGVACGGGGLSGTSNTRSLTAPLNSILAWLCLAVGVPVMTTQNLGGYIPSSSLSWSVSFVLSVMGPTKKSISLSTIYIEK